MERSKISDIRLIRLDNMDEIKSYYIGCQNSGAHLWYRGVSNASYRLIPKAYRDIEPYADQYGRSIEEHFPMASGTMYLLHNYNDMLLKFKDFLTDKIKEKEKFTSYFDWMFLAQHFGLATPLLDWTEDYRVALWFASDCSKRYVKKDTDIYSTNDIVKDEFSDEYMAIYQMNPDAFNNIFAESKQIDMVIDVEEYKEYMKAYLPNSNCRPYGPLCIKGKWDLDTRLANQKGHFTIHGTCIWAIDYYTIGRKILSKILIPIELVNEIRKWLSTEGITRKYIYQGRNWKEEIAKKLNEDELKEYDKALTEFKEQVKANTIFMYASTE